MKKKTSDILAPRPNPEIPQLLKIIESKWKELKAEKDFTCRKGHAAILVAHLESLLDEPETVSGASLPGLEDDSARWFTPGDMPEVDRFTGERPFDGAGECSGLFFFCTDTGRMSPLHGPPVIDPYNIRILWSYGYFVHAMEKIYATVTPTLMHVPDPRICERLLKAEGFRPTGSFESEFVLFIDPKGCSSPLVHTGFFVVRFEKPEQAKMAADFLAGCLSVRFLVAQRRYTVCTH